MTPASATTQKAYSTAIALNNVGVSLLERHSYDHALEAFNEAVMTMRKVVSEDRTPGAVDFCPVALGASLQKARHNLRTCISFRSDPHLNVVVLNEEEKEKLIDLVLQEGSSLPITPLIRIELQGRSLRDLVENPNVNHDSSIILYNYGRCCKCLAWVASTAYSAEHYYCSAFHLLELSHALLNGSQDKMDDTSSTVDEVENLPISILILHSLSSVAMILGMEEATQQIIMMNFLEAKETAEGLLSIYSRVTHNAAAAA